MMKRPFLFLAFTLVAAVGIYAPGCSSKDDHEDDHDAPADPTLADVTYLDETSDEALRALLAVKATADVARAAAVISPVEGDKVPSSPIPSFQWDKPKTGGLVPPKAPRRSQDRARLRDLVGPPRTAHAHGNPLNGEAYFVTFSTPTNPKLLRVFTAKKTYVPDESAWSKLKAAGTSIQVAVTTAVFENNAIAASGGPFTSTPVTFTITP